MFNNKERKNTNAGHFWMHLLATNNEYRRRNISSNFLDFGQFSVNSREVNVENNEKRLMFFLVLLFTFGV